MQKLKLAKLLYLAERSCAEKHGHVMFHDRYFAIKHGPIPTQALSGIDGLADQDAWSPNLERDGNMVRARPERTVEDLDHLSVADRRIGDELLAKFGGHDGMTASQIRAWTHTSLPEYKAKAAALAAGRSSVEMTPLDLAVGIGHADPQEFAEVNAELRDMAEG